MLKKILSISLALIMALSCMTICFADGETAAKQLSFNSDGKFRIVHITDIQDNYPMFASIKQYIKEMLVTLKPDLVILGGDNTVCGISGDDNFTVLGDILTEADLKEGQSEKIVEKNGKKMISYGDLTDEQYAKVEEEYVAKVKKLKEKAIEELAGLFADNKTYFTLVFGNHDHQQFGRFNERNRDTNKEYLLSLYQKYGKEYCLATDDHPELSGVGTQNLTVLSSDGTKVAYNLYMIDSNTYYYKDGKEMGYDAVHTDQIEWCKGVASELKQQNGGKAVPAMTFQHIIIQEIYEKLFVKSLFSLGDVGEDFESYDEDGVYYYSYLPKVANMESGFLFEKPCPGYYNYGQFDAVKEAGDVVAMFSGHDHTNDFTVDIDGIKVINTGGCTFNSYGSELNRGVRVIDLDEKELSNDSKAFETFTYTLCEAALADGSKICDQDDEVTEAGARFAMFGLKFMNIFVPVLKVLLFFIR